MPVMLPSVVSDGQGTAASEARDGAREGSGRGTGPQAAVTRQADSLHGCMHPSPGAEPAEQVVIGASTDAGWRRG